MNSDQFSTPILFLIFNRPDTTARVFQQIRAVKPKHLFVSADGPRPQKPGEADRCAQARAIIKNIDWECEIKTNFSDKNQGCKIGVSSGIDWFFQQVEEGIILEDDCLPDISFFHFCETLLEYYRDDERVMHIGGVNFQDGHIRGTGTYYFSQLNHIWGWATWKRAWNTYDVHIGTFPQVLKQDRFRQIFQDFRTMQYWLKQFDRVYANNLDTWDVQWQYAMSVQNGLAILPNINLISNIGFDQNATHTVEYFHKLAHRPTSSIGTIIHPTARAADFEADLYSMRIYMNPNKLRKLCRLLKSMIDKPHVSV